MSQTLPEALAAFNPGLPLAVALSGGADSTALLLACAEKWPGQVRAMHVHHGLQPAADGFQLHCETLCARLGVPLAVRRVDARHARGASPEDAARRARYEAFEAIPGVEWKDVAIENIAIAQHADDQVETILLALSRGAGLPGLSAMPGRWERGALTYHRPLLAVPAQALRAWLRARGQPWVEDPSNANEGFARNRIRARVLPAIESTFAQFRETFARSAAHAAQAQAILSEVAAQDLAALGCPPRISMLQALSRPRQANLLRYWLRRTHGTVASTAQLEELLAQIAHCTTRGHRLHLKVGSGFVVRKGDFIHWQAA
jgi:tRNA(Ile)-lysidine synthase